MKLKNEYARNVNEIPLFSILFTILPYLRQLRPVLRRRCYNETWGR